MLISTEVRTPIHDSFRVRQLAGMFDLPVSSETSQRFNVELPSLEEDWQIGLIVGPSGSGKSTIAKAAFGEALHLSTDWPADHAVIDGFGERSVKEITHALSCVGFSSPPAWLRPYAVLSNGEKFRCDLARSLLAEKPLIVFDEFTSVVDRTVERIGSAAVSKAIRSGRIQRRFVAVSCHYDIAEWLEPDWVLDMANGKLDRLARGRLRRPPIALRILRVDRSAWHVFKRHHYLNSELNAAAGCFVAMIENSPAAFTAVLPFPHPHCPGWREHRTVCLPDFQGLGIGHALAEFVASLYAASGKPYTSVTSHPAMIRHRARSKLWVMTRSPSRAARGASRAMAAMTRTSSFTRLTAGFRYVGAARASEAEQFGLRVCRSFPSTLESKSSD